MDRIGKRLRLLVISQMFPCKRHPTSGIFFANIMRELVPHTGMLTIITPRPYIPKVLTKINKKWTRWYLDPMISHVDGMEIIRPYFLYMRGISYEGLNGILMEYSLLKLIKKLHRERKYDLVLGLNLLPDGIAAVKLAEKINIPSVVWCIGSDINDFAQYNFLNNYYSRRTIETTNLVLTTSRDLEVKVRKMSTKAVNVMTFYRGIDLKNFENLPSKKVVVNDLRLDSKKKYILFIGRLIYDKGIYELSQAFSAIARRFPDIDLLLIGEALEKEKLEEAFRHSGTLDRVHFRGIIPYQDIGRYMKISEFLVLPTWAEGLPNVILEAMATGLPVVATNVGGIPEVLEHEVTGLSCPAKDYERLTRVMVQMFEDDLIRKKCIGRAREVVQTTFDVKKNVLLLHSLLSSLSKS